MTYKIAICDDSPRDVVYIENILNTWALERQLSITLEVFPSAESFLFRYAEEKGFDILLLDIEMGGMDGVALAKKIREGNQTVQIVFITGFADYMAEGYEVSALHYLMKPVKKEKLCTVLDRAAAGLTKVSTVLLLPVAGEMLRLAVEQIQYVEAFSHSVSIHTEKKTFEVKLSISEMEQRVREGFVRCHRSYLVNLKYVARISKKEVFLDDGKTLPLSRNAASAVNRAFVKYYTGDEHETF